MSGCAAHPTGQQYCGSVGVDIVLKQPQDIQHANSSVSVSFGLSQHGGHDDSVVVTLVSVLLHH